MSADLLEAFGGPAPSQDREDHLSQGITTTGAASTVLDLSRNSQKVQPIRNIQEDDFPGFSVSTPSIPSHHEDPAVFTASEYPNAQDQRRWPPKPQSLFNHDPTSNTDVLFDALDPSNDFLEDVGPEEDDEFGEFETVPGQTAGPVSTAHQPGQDLDVVSQSQKPVSHGLGPSLLSLAEPPGSTSIQQSQPRTGRPVDLLDLDQDTCQSPTTDAFQASSPQARQGSSVNTEDQHGGDDSFDEWGDFTTTMPTTPQRGSTNNTNKSPRTESTPTRKHEIQGTASTRLPPGLSLSRLEPRSTNSPIQLQKPALRSVQPKQPSKRQAEPKVAEDEAWEDFVDGPSPPNPPSQLPSKTQTPIPPTLPSRPTNIPPPSILLQLFPSIISDLRASIPPPSSSQPTSPDLPSTLQNTHFTLAHLISGRALRWKRDTLLAQSTKIAPSGAPKGMKLASLDRAETLKEDREVADILALWSKNAHMFNSVVTKSGPGAGGRLVPLTEAGMGL